MQKLFNKILVPVDFSAESVFAIIKAAALATQYNCSLTLLHVVNPTPFDGVMYAEHNLFQTDRFSLLSEKLKSKLEGLAHSIHENVNDQLKIESAVTIGYWNDVVIDFIRNNGVDLVLIGQKKRLYQKRKMILNPDFVTSKSNIPVITVPSNRNMTGLHSIVIPVTDFLPIRKLIYGVYIASQNKCVIRLLGIQNKKTQTRINYYLKKAYQLIHDHCDLQVELETVYNVNVADAINQYAKDNSAGLVILNPGSQTKMPGFFSRLWGNIIQKYAVPPVLTVNPI